MAPTPRASRATLRSMSRECQSARASHAHHRHRAAVREVPAPSDPRALLPLSFDFTPSVSCLVLSSLSLQVLLSGGRSRREQSSRVQFGRSHSSNFPCSQRWLRPGGRDVPCERCTDYSSGHIRCGLLCAQRQQCLRGQRCQWRMVWLRFPQCSQTNGRLSKHTHSNQSVESVQETAQTIHWKQRA